MKNPKLQSLNAQCLSAVYSSEMEEWALIKALVNGDQRAYKHLYDLHGRRLLSNIKGIVKCQDIAEDLLQETFVKFYRHIGCFNTEKGLLCSWLNCLAKHTAIDYQRSKTCRNQMDTCTLEGKLEEIEQQEYTFLNTDLIGLQEVLLTLNGTQQLLIRLIYLEGFSHTEAAEYLNIPLGTVKSRTRRAIQIMRQYFY